MKSFLLNKDNHPTIKWGLLEDNIFFEGQIPEGFFLAVCPSGNYIILDVDVKQDKYGFDFIPQNIKEELDQSFHYKTKSGGFHYWISYTGNKILLNKATKYGLDLRIGKNGANSGGFVRYYHPVDIRNCINLIKNTSENLNIWLEDLFANIKNN